MEVESLLSVVDRLEDHIDDLEEALQPLLKRSLDGTSKRLPLLERAKLHTLITYTLESLIFSYLKIHGIKAQEHPVFKELARVRQYFAKIKKLEDGPEEEAKPSMKLDQQAARRFINHSLAGNEKYDIERAEKLAKEKARAQLRANLLAKQTKEESGPSTPSSQQAPHTSAPIESCEAEPDSSSESEDSEMSEDESSAAETSDNKTEMSTARSEALEDFIQLPSEPVATLKNAKKKTAKAKAKKRKEDAIQAKKAQRQAKREAQGIPEPDSKQLKSRRRKERRRKKEVTRKEQQKSKDKKKGKS